MKKRLAAWLLALAASCILATSLRAQNTTTFGNIVAVGTPCGQANCVYYQLPPGTPWVNVTLSGSWSGTIEIATTYAPNANYSNLDSVAWTVLTTETGNGTWTVSTGGTPFTGSWLATPPGGAIYVRARATSWTSGSARVDMASLQSMLSNPIFAGIITGGGLMAPDGGSASNCWLTNGTQGACGGSSTGAVLLNPGAGVTQTVTQQTGTQLLTNILNGDYYASQFGTSSTGIASAISAACPDCSVIAGVNYGQTETLPQNVAQAGAYGTGNYLAMPVWPGWTELTDKRGSYLSRIFMAPTGSGSYYPSANNAKFPYGLYFESNYDVTVPGNTVVQTTSVDQSFFNGPGNQINGFGGVNLKSYDFGPVTNMASSDQGQHLERQGQQNCYGVGDCLGGALEDFITCAGGASTYNDEGCHAGDLQVKEDNNVYHGTIANVTSDTVMKDTVTAGAGTQGDGRYRIDLTQIAASGSFPTAYLSTTTPSANLAPPTENFVGTSFPVSTVLMVCDPAVDSNACAVASTDPNGRINSVAGGYAPGTITFDVMTTAPSMKTGYATNTTGLPSSGLACVADQEYFETTTYNVISSSQISLNLRKPHLNGMTVGIGGECQTGLEVTGTTFQYNHTGTKYRQVWPVIASLSGTQLLVFDHDSQQGWSNAVGYEPAICATDSTPVSFTASGNTITVYDSTSSPNFQPTFAGNSAIITTANSSYNGTWAITVGSGYFGGLWHQNYKYTVTTTPSGTAPTSGTIQFCNTGFNLYPAAEVLSVLDPANNTVDGYHSLAPNTINWTVGDLVEDEHYFWQQVNLSGGLWQIDQKLPRPPYNNIQFAGVNYSSFLGPGFPGWTVENSTAQYEYRYFGGGEAAPGPAFEVGGYFNNLFESLQPPAIGSGAIIAVDSCQPTYGCNDPLNSPFKIYSGPSGGTDFFWDNTYAQAINFAEPIQIGGLTLPNTLFVPVSGTIAASMDLGSSFTPDATFEAKGFQAWSTYTPPTGFQHVEIYGDGSSSLGMIFPIISASAAVNGGNFSMGSMQLYLPSTTTAVKEAGFSADGTPGDVLCDDATIGDAGCNLKLKTLTINGGAAIVAASIANMQLSMPTSAINTGACTSYTATTMTGLAATSTVTFQNATDDTGVTGWDPTAPSLTIDKYPAANTLHWRVCNSTGASITPGAITMNVSAR
jgi:hypothetical protein